MDLISPIASARGASSFRLPDGKDDASPGDRPSHHGQPPGSLPHRPSDRRKTRRGHGHAAFGEGRGPVLDVRRAPHEARPGREMVMEKAKRLVEMGRDVVILLDSITRMARAYNTVTPRPAGSFREVSTPTPSRSPRGSSAPRGTSRKAVP